MLEFTLSIVLTAAAPSQGATMRTWHLAESMQALAQVMPGQPPNAWTKLDTLDGVALPTRQTQVLSLIDGTITVDRAGEWCFELVSDDGSQLWMTGTNVVDHDGLHGPEAKTGCKSLDVGAHAFQIKWFQQGGGAELALRWKGPGDDAFTLIPTRALHTNWPASRPTADGDKLVASSPARRRAGDGRSLDAQLPSWRRQALDIDLDGPVVAMTTDADGTVFMATEAGTVYLVDVEASAASRFAGDLPTVRVIEAQQGAVLVGTDAGVLQLEDVDGDGVADSERAIETLVPIGPRRHVADGALRTRHGAVIMALDPTLQIDRLLAEVDAGGHTYMLLGAPNEVFGSIETSIDGRPRASLVRLSGESVRAATVLPDFDVVLAGPDGVDRVGHGGEPTFMVEKIEPKANGLAVHMSEPAGPEVLGNTDHWVVTWIDAAGDSMPLHIDSASGLLDGRGAFLAIDNLPVPGTVHVRMVGPWVSMQDNLLWSPEVWGSVHAPLPTQAGRVLPRVRPRDNDLSPREQLDGWTILFDGKDASLHWRGFKKDHLPEQWETTEGELVFTGKGGGDIITREQYDDFDLHLEWMVQPKGNSGIFFNVAEDGGAVWATGPEMQILDNARHADGRNALTSAGANYALHAPPFDASLPSGHWNCARIRVQGNHVQHWLNGVKTADYHLRSPEWNAAVADSKFAAMPRYGKESSGHIALQDHGDRVAFRNIRIRRLDTK